MCIIYDLNKKKKKKFPNKFGNEQSDCSFVYNKWKYLKAKTVCNYSSCFVGATVGHRSLKIYYKQNLPQRRVGRSNTALPRILAQYKALGWTGTTSKTDEFVVCKIGLILQPFILYFYNIFFLIFSCCSQAESKRYFIHAPTSFQTRFTSQYESQQIATTFQTAGCVLDRTKKLYIMCCWIDLLNNNKEHKMK